MFSDMGNAMAILFCDPVYGSNSNTKPVLKIKNKSKKQCFSGKTIIGKYLPMHKRGGLASGASRL